MPLTKFNGTTLSSIFFNGVDLVKVYFNNVLVFVKGDWFINLLIDGDFENPATTEWSTVYPDTFTIENGSLVVSPDPGSPGANFRYIGAGFIEPYKAYRFVMNISDYVSGDAKFVFTSTGASQTYSANGENEYIFWSAAYTDVIDYPRVHIASDNTSLKINDFLAFPVRNGALKNGHFYGVSYAWSTSNPATVLFNGGYVEVIPNLSFSSNLKYSIAGDIKLGKTYDFEVELYDYVSGDVYIVYENNFQQSPVFSGNGVHTFRHTMNFADNASSIPQLVFSGNYTAQFKVKSFHAFEVTV